MSDQDGKSTQLEVTSIGDRDGLGIVSLKDDAGRTYELPLNNMDLPTVMNMLGDVYDRVLKSPGAAPRQAPGLCQIQLEVTSETIFLRLFPSPHVYHEYFVRRNDPMSAPLLEFERSLERHQVGRTTHPLSDAKN